MSVLGAAQGALRGQGLRGSMRGRRLAGRNPRYTSLGVLPRSVVWGRCSLYQEKNELSSERNRALCWEMRILRIASSFIVLMKRSTTAMPPCFPTAPNRGRIALRLHHRLKASHQKILSLSQIKYLGVALARVIVLPRNARADNESGRFGKDREAHRASKVVIDNHGQPPTERPALRKSER